MLFFQVLVGVLIVVGILLLSGIKIIKEYERAVILRLGRLVGIRGPGIIFVIPVVEEMERVSLRVVTLDVPAQEVMTIDNVPVEVNAVVYFRVNDPEDAIIQINNYYMATSEIAQTTLRSVLGQVELDELLSEREKINQRLQDIIDEETDPWGVKVTAVEIKNVELPDTMQRVMARQAEAERERRAKIISAKGEHQAAEQLHLASKIIGQNRTGVQLRFLQTLTEISSEDTTTIAFPIPIDVFNQALDIAEDIDVEDMPDPEDLPDPEDMADFAEEGEVDIPDPSVGPSDPGKGPGREPGIDEGESSETDDQESS